MADDQRTTFPDLPVSQWWKLRTFFKSKLPTVVNLEYLMSTLNISETTANNTLRNLAILGIIDNEGKTTELANRWRDDELYSQVCKDIRERIYPEELRDIAQAAGDRSSLVSWFGRKTRIGEKAAHKNAAIFEVIKEGDLSKVKEAKEGKVQTKPRTRSRKSAPPKAGPVISPPKAEGSAEGLLFKPEKPYLPDTPLTPTIHIDVQIHISPEAKPDQIEKIFESIAKHLYQSR